VQTAPTVYPTEYPKRFTVQIESLTNSVVEIQDTLYIVLRRGVFC